MLIKVLLAVTLAVYVQADSVCPDKKQQCDSDHTCCRLPLAVAGSEWGCCPFESGVCCADGSTCCPANHLCVPGKRACVPNEPIVTEVKLASELKPSMAVSEQLKTRSKLLGRSSGNVHRFEMPSSRDADVKLDAVGETEQPSANCTAEETACSASTCCPLPEAVCCPNQRHCCPSGTTCDLTVARCVAGSSPNSVQLPLYSQFSKQQPTQIHPNTEKSSATPNVKEVVCPDGTSSCADGATCCMKENDQYGCCPLPNAVCCSDKKHCCPQNKICDVEQQRCLNQMDGSYTAMFKKYAAHKIEAQDVEVESKPNVKDVVCPDGSSSCADGATCCILESGQYGCCPLPNAVCCSDKQHCCPNGTTCDVVHGRCVQSDGSFTDFLKKLSGHRN